MLWKAINPNTVDEWLEHDLIEAGLLTNDTPSKQDSLSPALPTAPPTPSEPAMESIKPTTTQTSPALSNPQLASFLKVVALLGSLSSNNQTSKAQQTARARNNDDNRLSSSNPSHIISKRQKNTDAARRSRQRKLFKMESLERRVRDLEANNGQLQQHITESEQERNLSAARATAGKKRMEALEAQLAAAHALLMNTTPPP
ncbi:hypothetical protein J3Q64DRAFT_1629302 [Phycomyces blakesleeanus]|uniref:BZIP domain-containing protein n=1 Tax=Phycomyces blakesleeanus TaxID=4837 RepID=A0ABR3BHK5_PHYBL